MKNHSFKLKHSALPSVAQKTPLISAAQIDQAKNLAVQTPRQERSNATKAINSPDFDSLPDSGFVRLPSLLLLFACSRATIWRWVKAKKIPTPKKLGPRVTAWNIGELRQVISAYMKEESA
ncbi:MAG: AlpA family phage regulatory protein [Betaproteobacteria bacterium]